MSSAMFLFKFLNEIRKQNHNKFDKLDPIHESIHEILNIFQNKTIQLCCIKINKLSIYLNTLLTVQVAEQSSEILELPIDELTTLIGEDELNVTNEETAWELALRWIGRDPEIRKVHIVELMRNIRLGLMDTYYFLEHVKNNQYVAGNEACRPIVIETLKFLYDPDMIKQKEGDLEIATPRVPHDILFAIGGWRGVSAVDLIETYDTRADRWVKVGLHAEAISYMLARSNLDSRAAI